MGASSSVNFDTDFFTKYATVPNYLGKGAFANVYGPIQLNGMQVAIKQVWFATGKSEMKQDLEVKRQIWTSLEHKHLIKIYSVDINQLPKVMHIVMEYAAGGSLNNTVKSLGSEYKLPIYIVTDWTKEIVEGMLYLHKRKIVHRDLKTSNILLMEPYDATKPQKRITLKITDFDEVREHDHTTTMTFVGTCAYMAPEVLLEERFSKASDVWSFGVLTWEMLSGDIPHKGLQPSEIIGKLCKGELDGLVIPPSFPDYYKFILEKCWKGAYEERLSFQQILDVLDPTGDSYRLDPVLVETIIRPIESAQPGLKNRLTVLEFRTAAKQTGDICDRNYAMAILGKELFIVSVHSSNVHVYDSIKFNFDRLVTLKNLNMPLDIVSCIRNRCLYILHYQGNLCGIVRVDSNGKLLRNWSIGDNFGVGLSATSKGNIIVNVSSRNTLIEYSSKGALIRELNLSKTRIRHPACIIQLTNGDFLISHGNSHLRDDLHRVCIVDAAGRVTKSFGGECGFNMAHVYNPSHLIVDSDGFVMVVDEMNNRVLLLDSNLTFQRVILSNEHHGVAGSMKILLDESTGRLFVADNLQNTGGRILIFDCK